MIQIQGKTYELVKEHRNGWNADAFKSRYSDVLDRYDFIVGDWGYSQLRLKGFFKDQHGKGNKDASFPYILDYINEYCNFGCPYFIIRKTGQIQQPARKESKQGVPALADQEDE